MMSRNDGKRGFAKIVVFYRDFEVFYHHSILIPHCVDIDEICCRPGELWSGVPPQHRLPSDALLPERGGLQGRPHPGTQLRRRHLLRRLLRPLRTLPPRQMVRYIAKLQPVSTRYLGLHV